MKKKKPSIAMLKKRSAVWIDNMDDLRITLSDDEQIAEKECVCKSCMAYNSWYRDKDGNWVTSFFSIDAMRAFYDFAGFI